MLGVVALVASLGAESQGRCVLGAVPDRVVRLLTAAGHTTTP
jgi:hypothetical protein